MICDLDLTVFKVAEEPEFPQIRAKARENFTTRYSKLVGSPKADEESLCNITKRLFVVAKSTDEIVLDVLNSRQNSE